MISRSILAGAAIAMVLNCSNPASVTKSSIPNANLSAQDKADITALALHFSTREIDSIAVQHYSIEYVRPVKPDTNAEFYGTVAFDSAFTDTDRISYQSLMFFNRKWLAYNADSAYDTGRVFVNNWYSTPQYFSSFDKRIFRVDSISIITRADDSINKPLATDLLRMVLHDQYSSLNSVFHVSDSLASVESIDMSTKADTTFFHLTFVLSVAEGTITYNFTYTAGVLLLTSISEEISAVSSRNGQTAL